MFRSARSARAVESMYYGCNRRGSRRLNGRRVERDQATYQGRTNQTKATHNHKTISTTSSVAVIEGSSLKTAPCLSSSLARPTKPTHQPPRQLVQLRDRQQLHLGLLASGRPGRSRPATQLRTGYSSTSQSHITNSSYHQNILYQINLIRVNFDFINNFVTTKVIFLFIFIFLQFLIKLILYFGHFQAK